MHKKRLEILMPALSPTMEEGKLVKWHVREGEVVSPGTLIAEVETDKATLDVEAIDDGTIGRLLVAEGTEGVKVDTAIAELIIEDGAADENVTDAVDEADEPQETLILPALGRVAERSGDGRSAPIEPRRHVAASPLARRFAEQNGADIARVVGTGPEGRVMKRDIELFLERRDAVSIKAADENRAGPRLIETIPLSNMRRTIARRMTESFRDVPHFPLEIDIVADSLIQTRVALNDASQDGTKVSLNDLMIKAAAISLMRVPGVNVAYSDEGIRRYATADIAVAISIEDGLITPIVRSAEAKGIKEISKEVKRLSEAAHARKLKPTDYEGGTFSISNLGMFGVKAFSSILNMPQACILSVGAVQKRPAVVDDRLVAANLLTVTLTCDHRAVDGVLGAQFLQVFADLLSDPTALLT